jgi:hypothetical protein
MHSEVLWPLSANAVESNVVDDILTAFEMFSNTSDLAQISGRPFKDVDLKDPVFYGNRENVATTRDDLWNVLLLPVLTNYVIEPQLDRITDSPTIYDFQSFITQVRNPLEYFELDDAHFTTGDIVVSSVIEDILVEFDPELPLVLREKSRNSLPTN